MTKLYGLHIVTDAQLTPGRGHKDIAAAAIEAAAPVLQLRDKLLSDAAFYTQALALREITRRAGTLFIVNDRVDIALAVRADGVHVGETDMPARVARRLIGSKLILGVSAGSLDEALTAAADGADYVGFGPVFATATKDDAGRPTGLELLRQVKSAVRLPVVAIGGISEQNIQAVAEAGADAAAVVSCIVCAQDMPKTIRRLMSLLAEAKAS
jgi:thiamine-phosphate pyrophosphorylase